MSATRDEASERRAPSVDMVAPRERGYLAEAASTAARSASRTADSLLERPRAVLGALICVQIAVTLALALSVTHNGWVYFQGGDQIWLSTQGWLVGQFELPPTELGYLWSYVLAPIMWVTGPTYVQALPPLVTIQVLVLGPVALLCVYGIASHIGGRVLGYWASFLWSIAPIASIPLFVDRYQERWTDHFLTQALGLTAMSDFPSMVLVLGAALFVVRSLDASRLTDAVMAGLLLGAAGAMKPPNLLMGVGAVLAYLVARHWRAALAFGAAVIPSLIVLALWKQRGLGQIPAFALEETRLAAGATLGAASVELDKYLELDFDHFRRQMDYLREFFWSARVAQWAPFAGLLAVVRVHRGALAALLGGWLGAFLLVKGLSTRADIQANTFWRLLLPAWPAYLLLFASIPLLVPTLARRLGDRVRSPAVTPIARRWIAVVAVATVAIPAVAIAASSPLEGPELAVVQDDGVNTILTSVDDTVELRVERIDGGQRLTWTDDSWRANVFYRVYRAEGADVECLNSGESPAQYCFLRATSIATTREHEYVDASAPANATYRIGVGANWIDDSEFGDVFAFSLPVSTNE